MATQGEYMDLPLPARVSEHMPDGHYVRKFSLYSRFLLDRVFQIFSGHGGDGSRFVSSYHLTASKPIGCPGRDAAGVAHGLLPNRARPLHLARPLAVSDQTVLAGTGKKRPR